MSNIEIVADFHTHTNHSSHGHGKNTIREIVEAALENKNNRGAGPLKAVAISDHGRGHVWYGIADMERYLREIEDIRKEYEGQIRVYSGYEANLQSLTGGLTDLPEEYADAIDIPSLGYHKMVRYPNPMDGLHFWFPKRTDKNSVEKNTRAVTDAMQATPAIVYITHPGYGLPVDKNKIAEIAARPDVDVLLEINAKHPEFTESELAEAANAGAMFIVGSDAHSAERVGDFAGALDKIRKAGIAASQIVNSSENIDAFLDRLEERRAKRGPRPFVEVLESVQERAAEG